MRARFKSLPGVDVIRNLQPFFIKLLCFTCQNRIDEAFNRTFKTRSYYAWLERPQTAIEKDDAELIEIIKILFQKG